VPRKLRVQYPGAIYHIMNRGDRREAIFKDDKDRRRFLQTLGQACEKTGWQVHAYCLMSNHFHLVIETPQPNLVAGMKWLLGTYTSRFNRRHHSGVRTTYFKCQHRACLTNLAPGADSVGRMARKLRIQYPGAVYHLRCLRGRRCVRLGQGRLRQLILLGA